MPTVAANGIDIHHETFGDPADPSLLLVCGLGMQSVGYDDELCDALAERGMHVIRYDNRDVGLSTHLHGAVEDASAQVAAGIMGGTVDTAYDLSDMAADGMALLDALGIDSAHVYGQSLGGMIAQTMAIEHPEKVASLTSVMSTTGEPGYGAPSPEVLGGLASIMQPAEARSERIESGVALQRLIGTRSVFDEARVRARVELLVDRAYDPEGVTRQFLAILASGSRAEALRGVEVPTMVLHGDEDPLVDISGGRRTAELVPGAEFRVMPGMGHDLPPAYWAPAVDAVADVVARV